MRYAETLPDVVRAEENLYTCSSEGISKITEAIHKYDLNKIVVASCTPRTHEPLFRSACEEAGVNKYLFEMANIRDQCSWVHPHEPEKATEKAKDLVRMAVAKSRLLKPLEEPEIDVTSSALVIGGGISGMTAALCLANQGFKVHIVEKEPKLGGTLKHLYKLYPTMQHASEILNHVVNSVRRNKGIVVFTTTTVRQVKGFIGNFDVSVQKAHGAMANFEVGTIIVATGASIFEPVGMYGYGEHDKIITQLQLEQLLKNGQLKRPERVAMIQCVGARDEKRRYCSRVCCMTAIKNATLIKDLYPHTDVYIVFRQLQTYGKHYEEYHRMAQDKGVRFVKYLQEKPPEVVSGENGKLAVNVYHPLLDEELTIKSDLVVLSTPLVRHEDAKELSQILKVPLGPDGFFFEAHVKLRPIDFATDGIYLCGAAHSPKDTPECISQALGVASRAAIPLALKRLRAEAIAASVNEKLCSGCGTCVKLCPYGAIEKDERGVARVNEVTCKGCGVCAATCPENAVEMRHFTKKQVTAQALAALGGTVI